jgi:ribosome-binding factor A
VSEEQSGRRDEGSGRKARLAASLRAEIADLVTREVKDPRVHAAGLFTVTRVDLSGDLRTARAFVSFTGDEKAGAEATEALGRAAGFIRGELARRLTLRRAPDLRFIHDRTTEHVAKIDALLKEEP